MVEQWLAAFARQEFFYALIQLGVLITFLITAVRAAQQSGAQFVELLTAVLFGLLLEQGDILIFKTYRYNSNWLLLGDVPLAIALTWAMIIVGAMNLSDALGLPDAQAWRRERGLGGLGRWIALACVAPMADAIWAILLDLSLDAVAIRMGLWSWTIRLDQGWFGVPWGNFFAWLFVAFWFSFFTRLVRAHTQIRPRLQVWWQLAVPFFSFAGLVGVLVPFVALESTLAVNYRSDVWIIFVAGLLVFAGVTFSALRTRQRIDRTPADHWLLTVRLTIHAIFLSAIIVTGLIVQLPVLLLVALAALTIELFLTARWLAPALRQTMDSVRQLRMIGARLK